MFHTIPDGRIIFSKGSPFICQQLWMLLIHRNVRMVDLWDVQLYVRISAAVHLVFCLDR